jgi:hypothetical protein
VFGCLASSESKKATTKQLGLLLWRWLGLVCGSISLNTIISIDYLILNKDQEWLKGQVELFFHIWSHFISNKLF